MKAIYLAEKGGAELLVPEAIPLPAPRTGEVLVKVHAAGITPTEFQWYPTFHTPAGQPRPFPIVLGHEFSGVVESTGPGVESVQAGDAVYGLNDWFGNGALAEYCAAHRDIAPGTYRAKEVGQASPAVAGSDECASASMTLPGFRCSAGAELTARAVRSPERLEACPTFVERLLPRQSGAVSRCAHYCVVPVFAIARKPRLLDHALAAVTPISALTAWQGLLDRAKLQPGERVLVHGAAGGVGTFAVQLVRWRGAHVIATASAANLDFVRSLGAHEVIDYRANRFEDVVRNVDIVFDCVGGQTLDRSWAVLAPNGRLVTIATSSAGSPESRVRESFMLVRADGPQLAHIASLIDAGELRVFVEAVYPLTEARQAYARAQQGGMRGKMAVRVAG